jgi:hypothetical protein
LTYTDGMLHEASRVMLIGTIVNPPVAVGSGSERLPTTRINPLLTVVGDDPFDFGSHQPQVLDADVNGDGAADLVATLSVDLSRAVVAEPIEVIIITDVEAQIGQTLAATEATIRLQADDGDTITGPIVWLDQPGPGDDRLLIGISTPPPPPPPSDTGDTGAAGAVAPQPGRGVVVVPASALVPGVHLLSAIEQGRLTSTDPAFADFVTAVGDVDGDGCRDVVVHTTDVARVSQWWGVGDANVLSGK